MSVWNRLNNIIAGVRRTLKPKETLMDDPNNPATPAGNAGEQPVAQPTIDVAAITKASVDAATAAIAEAIKPLGEQIKGLQDGLSKAATADMVKQTISEQIAAANASQAKGVDRAKFISEKMGDVPAAYLTGLGDDPAKFAEQEQAIRTTLKVDLAKLGVKSADVGGDAGGKKVSDAIDTSKMSAIELIDLGVKQTSGGQAAAAPASPAAAGEAAAAAK